MLCGRAPSIVNRLVQFHISDQAVNIYENLPSSFLPNYGDFAGPDRLSHPPVDRPRYRAASLRYTDASPEDSWRPEFPLHLAGSIGSNIRLFEIFVLVY